MLLRKWLPVSLILIPLMASAHNFVEGERVAPVGITDLGELVLSNDDIVYKTWNTAQLEGKVRVVQYIAGRRSAKKKNSVFIKAIKAADLPEDIFQPTTIVNTDDEIPGSGIFVRGKVEKNKRRYPWAQFIIDSDGLGRKAWKLKEESSTIVVLDEKGRIRWAKDGALSPKEVLQVITLLHRLIDSAKPPSAEAPSAK